MQQLHCLNPGEPPWGIALCLLEFFNDCKNHIDDEGCAENGEEKHKDASEYSRNHSVTLLSLGEEIVIVFGVEVGGGTCLATERLTIAELLKVVQTASDATIAVAVEGVEVDGGSAVYTAVYFGASDDFVAVSINDTGSGSGVGVDEVCVCICGVVGSFGISVTERVLDCGERRNASAVALELEATFDFRSRMDILESMFMV